MFVTMNRIKVRPEYWDQFEEHFRHRAGLVDNTPGFIRNLILRPDSPDAPHIVMTLWKGKDSFEKWTKSEAFVAAHRKAGHLPKDIYLEPGRLETFESVTDSDDA